MLGQLIVAAAIAGIFTGLLGAWVSSQKGRGAFEGFLLGFVFSLFGVLISALLPSSSITRRRPSYQGMTPHDHLRIQLGEMRKRVRGLAQKLQSLDDAARRGDIEPAEYSERRQLLEAEQVEVESQVADIQAKLSAAGS